MAAPKMHPGSLSVATGGAMANPVQAPSGFVWGAGGKPMSAEQARKYRDIEAALMAKGGSPSNLGEGLNRIGEALLATSYGSKAGAAEETGRARIAEALIAAQGGGGPDDYMAIIGDEWATPEQRAIAQAQLQRSWSQTDQQAEYGREDAQIAQQREWELADQEAASAQRYSERKSDFKHDYSMFDRQAAQPTVINDQLVMPTSGEVVGDYRTPPKPADQPAAVDEYNWWAEQERAAGRTPMPYLDFVQAQKGSGLSITTPDGTVISQGGGKYGQTVGGGFGEAFMQIQNSALSAVQGMGTLDAMEQTLADPGFYSGFGGEQVLALKQAAAAIGIDPEGVTSMETFNALSKKAALDSMGGSLGAGFSNADRGFVEQQVASLATTPEGNRQLIQLQRKLAERKIEIAQLANQYAQAKGGIDAGFTDFLAQWSEANPLFPQTATPGAGGAVPGQPNAAAPASPAGPQSQPPSISSPQEYDALPPGSPYLAPDGTIRTKGQ